MTRQHLIGLLVSALFFAVFAPEIPLYAQWDGPAQHPGVAASTLLKPSSYIDGNVEEFFGKVPMTDARLRANVILYEGESNTWQASVNAQHYHFGQNIDLLGTGVGVPKNLNALDAGLAFSHKLENGNSWGLNLSGGSRSDVLFNSFHEVDISATGTYRLKVDQYHSWLFFLNMSTTRAFAPRAPIPGVGYFVIYPEAHAEVLYGLPFFFNWKPAPDWNFRFVYFIPTLVNTELAYTFHPRFKAHLGFDWLPQAWLRANRPDPESRLILDQKKATLGVRVSVHDRWYVDLSGGYAFDQSVFEAHSYFTPGAQKNYIPSEPLAKFEVAYKL